MSDEKDKPESNIKELPNKEHNDYVANLEKMKRNMQHIMESVNMLAQMRWAMYQAHREAGFSEEQALKIVLDAK